MTTERMTNLDARAERGLEELRGLIRDRFPEATFAVERAHDDSALVHLTAVVDLEDPDVVLDVVMERLLELQLEEALPITVIPLRTPERADAVLRARRAALRV